MALTVVIAIVAVLGVAGVAIRVFSQSEQLETIPAAAEQSTTTATETPSTEIASTETPTPLGPFDFAVHDAIGNGETLVATRLIGDERPCYEADGDWLAQSGFGAEVLLVDAVGGDETIVVTDIVVQTEELFTDRLATVGTDRFALFNWCDVAADSFLIVDPSTDPPAMVGYTSALTAPVPSPAVWSADGDTLMMTFRDYLGDERSELRPSVLVTYDGLTGEALTEEETDRRLLAELADQSRLYGTGQGELYLDDTVIDDRFDPYNDRVEVSLDGNMVAVFGGNGIVVVAAGDTAPTYSNSDDVRAVEWLPDGTLLLSVGCCGVISDVTRVEVTPPGSAVVEKPVELDLPALSIEELTWVAGDRLAVSSGNSTWLVNLPSDWDTASTQSDDLRRLVPEAADFGPGWTDGGTDTGFGGQTMPEGGQPPQECPNIESITFPERTLYTEYGFGDGIDDASVFAVEAANPETAQAMAETFLSWMGCPEFAGGAPIEPSGLAAHGETDALIGDAGTMAVAVIDNRLLVVLVEQDATATDVVERVLVRESVNS